MKPAIAILFLCASALSASALDLATRDGRVFENVRVTRVEPDGITVQHAAGLEKIPARLLSGEDRARYGLTPEAAREYAAQRQAAIAQRERDLRNAEALAEIEPRMQKQAGYYLLCCIRSDENGVLARNHLGGWFFIPGFKAFPETWFNIYAAPTKWVQIEPTKIALELVPLSSPNNQQPSHAPALDKKGH